MFNSNCVMNSAGLARGIWDKTINKQPVFFFTARRHTAICAQMLQDVKSTFLYCLLETSMPFAFAVAVYFFHNYAAQS